MTRLLRKIFFNLWAIYMVAKTQNFSVQIPVVISVEMDKLNIDMKMQKK